MVGASLGGSAWAVAQVAVLPTMMMMTGPPRPQRPRGQLSLSRPARLGLVRAGRPWWFWWLLLLSWPLLLLPLLLLVLLLSWSWLWWRWGGGLAGRVAQVHQGWCWLPGWWWRWWSGWSGPSARPGLDPWPAVGLLLLPAVAGR